MAPETLRLGRVGKPSDVYAFGIMMYEMWSAMRPYTTEQSPNQVSPNLNLLTLYPLP